MAAPKKCAVEGCTTIPMGANIACARHRAAVALQTLAKENETLRLELEIASTERDLAVDTPRLSADDLELVINEKVEEAIKRLLPLALQEAQQTKPVSVETKQEPAQPNQQPRQSPKPPQPLRRVLPPPPAKKPLPGTAMAAGRRPAQKT